MTYADPNAYLRPAGRAPRSALANTINADFDVLKGIENDYTTGTAAVSGGITGLGGDSPTTCFYRRIKGRVHGYGSLTFGASAHPNGSTVTIDYLHPSCPADAALTPMTVAFYDSSTGSWYIGSGTIDNTGRGTFHANGPADIDSATPFAWAAGDLILWSFEARAGEIQTTLR